VRDLKKIRLSLSIEKKQGYPMLEAMRESLEDVGNIDRDQ